jgi:ankyrin repeat protein
LLEAEKANQTMMAAVQRNSLEEVRQAIQQGARVNVRDDGGWSALTWAMMHQSVDLVKLLARSSADPSVLKESAEAIAQLDLGGPDVQLELNGVLNESLESKGRSWRLARSGR